MKFSLLSYVLPFSGLDFEADYVILMDQDTIHHIPLIKYFLQRLLPEDVFIDLVS
ncbi:hypothetical protein [Cyanobacterium sp. uoEpiScrs1]|uniref:hypothetical protein n=1 Tax=Cyanobacterium sp. uoEpiScrs1 TaxID=2976343 RepID=UPI002269ED36|nr:hypothetical protein [Cyanobacterium sp. uoEpiScrs1]